MIYNIIYDSAMTHPSRYSSIHDACHSKITNNNKYNDKQIICHLQITNHTKYNDKQIKLNQEHVRPRWGRIWLLPQWCKQVVIAIRNKWMINTKYYKWQNYDARRYYYFIIIIIALGQPEMVHYYPQYSTPYLVPQQVGLLMLLMLPLSSCHTHLQWQGSFILNQCTPSFYQYQPSSQQASPQIYCEKSSTHSRWCTLIRPTLRFHQSQADLPTTSTWGLRMTHLPKSLDSTFSTLAKMKTCIPRTNLACMNCTLNTVREASQIGGFIWDKTTHPIDLGLNKWDLGHRKWICRKFSTKRGSNMP